MKHRILLSMLTAIVVFAATTTADAGIFGRLSHVWNGCSPCEPVAVQPCEPIACEPAPCDMACGDCYGAAPCRPFAGVLANFRARIAARCAVPACSPCEPMACEPVVCEPAPCDMACGDCYGAAPCRPFAGFLTNLRARLAARCTPVCSPCEPVACEPCAACAQLQ